MNIADIIVEAEFDPEYEKKRLATALQNWQRTSANNYKPSVISAVPAEATKIYAGGKGGLSPADAISQAIENVKARQANSRSAGRDDPEFAKANMQKNMQKANKARSKQAQQPTASASGDRVGKTGKKWGNQYYSDPKTFGGKLKQFINAPSMDLRTANTAAGSGMDAGKNISGKLDAFMRLGDKFRQPVSAK